MHTSDIVASIKQLGEIKDFPGIRYFCNTHDQGTLHTTSSLHSSRIPRIKEVRFIFNDMDLDQQVRHDLNRIRQILFAFKIKI